MKVLALDFGSARQASGQSRTVTILVAPGYAPFEQYYSGTDSLGPWTDIYGLGATCYRAIAGRPPLDAIARSKGILGSTKEILLPAKVAGAGRYSEPLLQAIDHALEFAEKDRPQTLADWKIELATVPAQVPVARPRPSDPEAPSTSRVPLRRGPLLWAGAGAAAVIVAVIMLPWLASIWNETPRASVERKPEAPPSAEKPAEPSDALRQRLDALEKQLAEERARRDQERQREAERQLQISLSQKSDAARAEAEREARKRADAERKEKERAARLIPIESAPRSGPQRSAKPPSDPVPEVAPVVRFEPSKPEPLKPEGKQEQPKVEPKESPKVDVAKVDPLVVADRAIAQANYGEAIAVLKPLADDSNSKAQVRLGRLYLEGQGVPRNEAEAARLFHKAAERGENEARLRLGDMYANGRGVRQSNFQAYIWYGAAARGGNAAAKASQERVAAALQPAEISQAGKVIDSLVANKP